MQFLQRIVMAIPEQSAMNPLVPSTNAIAGLSLCLGVVA